MWIYGNFLRDPRSLGAVLCLSVLVPWSLARADRSVEERRPADPRGAVEVVSVSGSVAVSAWDRAEVEVSGTTGADVERVELSGGDKRTAVRLVPLSGTGARHGEASLMVHVPAGSSISVTAVTADVKLAGVQGNVTVQTVSGDVTGEAGGDLRVGTVNGSVRMTARAARRTEMKTINGDVHLTGGGGEVEITTVSGEVTADLAAITRGRFKSVSGTLSADLSLAPGGQLDGESVSGEVRFNFPSPPDAEFDIQSFSGDIEHCFGPAPEKSRYGPGSRLAFSNGTGAGRVHVDTKNGDVRICTGSRGKTAGPAVTRPMRLSAANLFYVL